MIKKARKYAQNIDLNIIGSLGLLVKAKEKPIIKSIKPLVKIIAKSNIFLDEKIIAIILKHVNEL
jgi:predicted nucleic acid-binding protein